MIQRKVDQQNFEKILGELKNQNLISKNNKITKKGKKILRDIGGILDV